MRHWLILLATFSLAIALVFFPGCGDEDDDNPTGPSGSTDTLDAEEILSEIENFAGSFEQIAESCPPMEFIGSLMDEAVMDENGALLFFLLSLIETPDISTLYGTWQADTTGQIPQMILVDSLPDNAVKLMMVGVDTLGNLLNGDLTIYNLTLGETENGLDMDIDIAVHVEGYTDSLHLSVAGTIGMDAEGEISSADITISGNSCAVLFSLTFETIDGTDMEISGWYEIPSVDKVNFALSGDLLGEGEVGSGTFHIWTEAAPTFDLDMIFSSDADTCITGEIEIDGNLAATIYATNCDEEEPDFWIVIDGVIYDGAVYIESFLDLLGFIEDVEMPKKI